MKKIFYLFLIFALMGSVYEADAQMNRKKIRQNNKRMSSFRGKKFGFGKDKAYSSIGFSLNTFNYYGDLSPKSGKLSTDLSFTRPGIGIHFSHRFGPRYQLNGAFTYGAIKGSDSKSADKTDTDSNFRYRRNLSFRNRIKELSVVASMDLFENMSTYISRARWTPYAFAGLAVFHHNPQAQVPDFHLDGVTRFSNAGDWINLRDLGTEGQYAKLEKSDKNSGIKPYKLIQVAIPFGVGARFRINQLLDFSVELGFRYSFTDYLDDVSKNYVDLGVFDSELAKAMSYRGNELSEAKNNPGMLVSYTSTRKFGGTYDVLPGFGSEHRDNWRGNKSDKDTYMITTFKLTYIVGKSFHRAKFR
jgi:hypothetical protein